METVTPRQLLFCLCAGAAIFHGQVWAAPPAEDLRRAFSDIRDDKVPHNCSRGTEWLLNYREDIREDLLAELYRTDRQGRDAILHVLFNTDSFQPDERFIRFVFSRMEETDRYVKSDSIFKVPSDQLAWSGSHWEAWRYIDDHFELFEPYVKEAIGVSENPFVLWAAAWLAKQRGIMAEYAPLFTPEVMRRAAANLSEDHFRYNASRAVRLFLLLGDQSLPALRDAARDGDRQAKMLARATIDALGGKRKAFGYLVSKVDVTQVLFGPPVREPEWLDHETEPYVENQAKAYP
ncbi:MAG TPA: hypothetical protein VGW57_01830 [Chthoniobacterales bacterium]|nr:hypothetical protein [Chthoniobacterales bacterium]